MAHRLGNAVEKADLPSSCKVVQVVYTPMINSKLFTNANKKYVLENFNMIDGEEGGPEDRPLVVQVRYFGCPSASTS